MAQEEYVFAKQDKERLFEELKLLLLPKDPLDEKDVVVEIRAGAGGDDASVFIYAGIYSCFTSAGTYRFDFGY